MIFIQHLKFKIQHLFFHFGGARNPSVGVTNDIKNEENSGTVNSFNETDCKSLNPKFEKMKKSWLWV